MSISNVLTIAGSDSSGGAGIQADLKTFSALKTYGASVITALTAQNTRGVTAIYDVPSSFVTAQIDAVFDDLEIAAVKVGMLSQPAIIEAVTAGLRRYGAERVVVDPVMVAKSGAQLLQPEAITALKAQLLPQSMLITPNLPEAGVLLDREVSDDESDMVAAAESLLAMGPQAVLLKGGHGERSESVDVLVSAEGTRRFAAPRLQTQNTHGTGCTLSSAIAAFLGRGYGLPDAVGASKAYISQALAHADRLNVGSGFGPVHHFNELWREELPGSTR